jgi:hypothetical protein
MNTHVHTIFYEYEHLQKNGSDDFEIHKVTITKSVSLSTETFMFVLGITPFLHVLRYLQ